MTTYTQQSAQSVEWTLQVWRSAANAIATDPQADRRAAYIAAVAEMSVSLPEGLTTQELVARFWSETLMMIAARASVRSDGRVLNAQVSQPPLAGGRWSAWWRNTEASGRSNGAHGAGKIANGEMGGRMNARLEAVGHQGRLESGQCGLESVG